MKCNVTSLKLVRRYTEDDGVAIFKDRYAKQPYMDEVLEIHIASEGMKYPISPYLHSKDEIEQFVAQCRGMVYWRNKKAWDDVGYRFTVGVDGISVWHKNGNTIEDLMFVFPGPVLADLIEGLALNRNYRTESSVELASEQLRGIAREYSPIARLRFVTDQARERYMDCLYHRPEVLTEKNTVELRNATRGLMRIARNHSDGKLVYVNISNDWADHSFYFTITDGKGIRFMNGGIIAHPTYKDDEIVGYSYSTHT